jgi:hypothetical protein
MIGDKNRFLNLKKVIYGSVSFGNNHLAKIIGRGTVNLESKDAMEFFFLLVKDMKQNLLSVCQMCNQGYTLQFNSEKCEIMKEGLGKLVATMIRTSNNIYVLNEIGKEICFLGKENEIWLSHIRIGHMNFDNLVKINRKESVKEIRKISKPMNTLCNHCLQGKKSKTKFKSKEYSTTKPLEIVHTDLCGPTRTNGLNGNNTS